MAFPVGEAPIPIVAYIGKADRGNLITVRYDDGSEQVDRVFAGCFKEPEEESRLLNIAQALNPNLRVISLINRVAPLELIPEA